MQRLSFVFLLLLSFFTAISSFAQEDPNCPGAPVPQLVVDGYGQVTEGDANNVRDQASRSGTKTGEIPAGGSFIVLEGPVCADGFNWWRVDYNGLVGWTVEGSGADYFVLPTDAPAPTPIPEEPISAIVYPLSADNALAVGVQARIDVAGLNIRANPSRDAAMLSQTVANEIVEIVGGSTEAEGLVWWQIKEPDGTVGWIVEQFREGANFGSEKLIQTIFPLCPYSTERLSFVLHPYIYTSAHDGTQRCVLYKLQTSDVYTTWGRLKYMVNDTYWSPQGDAFIFIDYAYNTRCCDYRLYSLSADGSVLTALSPNSAVDWAEWSPNGSKIALVQNGQAWVMNRDGSRPVRLSDTENSVEYVAWYPDNQTVFYSEVIRENDNGPQMGRPSHYIFHSVGVDLSNPQVLFNSENSIEIRDMALSPDGRYFVATITPFESSGDLGDGGGDYLYNTETWERTHLESYWNFLWSHDGQFLVSSTRDESQIITVATGETQSIGEFSPQSWSADGQRLYATQEAGFQVYEMATEEIQTYLAEEIEPLIGTYGDGGILSIREQGTD